MYLNCSIGVVCCPLGRVISARLSCEQSACESTHKPNCILNVAYRLTFRCVHKTNAMVLYANCVLERRWKAYREKRNKWVNKLVSCIGLARLLFSMLEGPRASTGLCVDVSSGVLIKVKVIRICGSSQFNSP